MEGVARRSLLATVGGVAVAGISGCLAGGSDGSGADDGSGAAAGSGPAESGAAGDGAASGERAAGLAGSLDRALGHVYRPASDDADDELPLRVERPASFADEGNATPGPVDTGSVEWAVGVDRPSSDTPRSVAVGEFGDADPASAAGVEPAGEVRALDSYRFHDWLLVVDADRLFLGDRAWIERVIDRHDAGEPGAMDRNPYAADLLAAASVPQAGQGWLVFDPDRWTEHLDVDPGALAFTPGSPDGPPGRVVAYRFADGYDEATVEHLRSAFAEQFDAPDVAVDERGETVVVVESTGDGD